MKTYIPTFTSYTAFIRLSLCPVIMILTLLSCQQPSSTHQETKEPIPDTTFQPSPAYTFERILDSMQIGWDSVESDALAKLDMLRFRFAGDTHPDIPRLLDEAGYRAFSQIDYKTISQNEDCYHNTSIPVAVRRNCFYRLMHLLVEKQQYQKAIRIAAEIDPAVLQARLNPWLMTSVDSLKRYLGIRDSLMQLSLPDDSLQYALAYALRTVVVTQFYCHEGCGGCDFTMVMDKLKMLIRNFPKSDLADNAAYDLIQYQHMYEDGRTEEVRGAEKEALTAFLKKYPGTDGAALAGHRLVEIEEILSYFQN